MPDARPSSAAPVTTAPDRRAALKARHRAAILHAARSLVAERSGPFFSADELAERADIARRTVFNHFASIDEILLTLCAEILDVIIDDFVSAVATRPVGADTLLALFDEITASLESTDLPATIASIGSLLGAPDVDDPRGDTLSDEAFTRVAERLLVEASRRHPGVDDLDVEILVHSLMSGVLVIAKRWVLLCGVRLDDDSRSQWRHLLNRLTSTLRSGYSSGS
ncbi:TetR/AcrR family transcriptional regulator [Frondihabitans sp. PhB161]|uniref:TetR/AcrR family transcriptional regulator n=1 Tax=Frondihabitans sp. PhB161 TaxID=2485193 RepID=UPI000F4EBB17|nr:TetR/AcrR family transcriptional regulator [Frondihabitans sp. PhB161]